MGVRAGNLPKTIQSKIFRGGGLLMWGSRGSPKAIYIGIVPSLSSVLDTADLPNIRELEAADRSNIKGIVTIVRGLIWQTFPNGLCV